MTVGASGAVCSCFCNSNVTVVYELYDKAPTLAKWVEISNSDGQVYLAPSAALVPGSSLMRFSIFRLSLVSWL